MPQLAIAILANAMRFRLKAQAINLTPARSESRGVVQVSTFIFIIHRRKFCIKTTLKLLITWAPGYFTAQGNVWVPWSNFTYLLYIKQAFPLRFGLILEFWGAVPPKHLRYLSPHFLYIKKT